MFRDPKDIAIEAAVRGLSEYFRHLADLARFDFEAAAAHSSASNQWFHVAGEAVKRSADGRP